MVMLPISLAYGEATGLGAVAGLYGAIAVGFFAAVFSGTRSQISGPTGPMTVTLAAMGAVGVAVGDVVAIVILAGLIQILMGSIRCGHLANYIPESVISGFMTGIGIFVILLQIGPFVGLHSVSGGIIEVVSSLPEALEKANPHAIIVAGVTLLSGFLWPEKLRRYFPAPLAAMVIGSIVALAVAPVTYLFWPNAPPLTMVDKVPTGLPEFHLPNWRHSHFVIALVVYAWSCPKLAVVGSVDSLMNARMADSLNARMAGGLTRPPHRPNRELIAQGIGNVAAGFIGGLPGSANTAATVINIRSRGGRIAGVFCALILLALVLSLGPLVKNVPIAVLAGVLVKIGLDLIDWRQALELARPVRRKYLLMTALNVILAAALAVLYSPQIGGTAAVVFYVSISGEEYGVTGRGMLCATFIGMAVPLAATFRRKKGFPWVTHGRQEYYGLSLMTLAAVLTVFDVLAAAAVGLLFSTLTDPPRQTSDDAHGSSDGVG